MILFWYLVWTQRYKGNSLIDTYKTKVSAEMKTICSEVLDTLEKVLCPNAKKILENTKDKAEEAKLQEAMVFYLKMAGDYYRYLSEIVEGGYDKKVRI